MSVFVNVGTLVNPETLEAQDHYFWYQDHSSANHPLSREVELTADQEDWLFWAQWENDRMQEFLREKYHKTFYYENGELV